MSQNICNECGKPFETSDLDQKICKDCWEKIVKLDGEGKGEDKA